MSNSEEDRISSGGMDRKITGNKWSYWHYLMIGGGLILTALFIYSLIYMGAGSSLNIEREKISVATVRNGTFQEFIPVTGRVQPIQTVYLDAIEGGVVEEVYRESGATVSKGDTILVLSNSDLRLTVMQRTSSIYDQINQTRNSRLNIEQNSLSLNERLARAENQLKITGSRYRRQKSLFEQNLIAEQKFLETKENYEYQQKRYQLIYESYKQDSIRSEQQLRQIDRSLQRMRRSLDAVQGILDRLVVTAPLSGQLSTIQLNPGQSIESGERIGQIDILDDYKVRVAMDEYHLSRISTGLTGTVELSGQSYQLEITKVYPVVENGEFQVDMEFTGEAPTDLRRGQTIRIRLEMGNPSKSLIVERGSFYQSTGGEWVYKLADDGESAIRQQIEIGRQNPEYFEVISGLEAGDRVITSGYNSFGEKKKLIIE